jgi:hypothetical protein
MRYLKIILSGCVITLLCSACGWFASAGPYPVFKDGRWGYIDKQGKMSIEPQFKQAEDFSDGLALALTDKQQDELGAQKVGFIDRTGKFVIEPQFPFRGVFGSPDGKVAGFSEGLEWYRESKPDAKTVIFDKKGQTVFELDAKKEAVGGFSDGLLLVRMKGDDHSESDRSYYERYPDYQNYYYDTSGKVVFKMDDDKRFATPFHDGLARIANYEGENDDKGYIDKTGKEVIPLKYKKAGDFSEGLAAVSEGGGAYGFIDKTGKMVIEPKYQEVGDFHDGLAVVERSGIWGYIDKQGDWAFAPRFSGTIAPSNFSEGLAIAFEDSSYRIINKSGESVVTLDSSLSTEKVTGTMVGEFKNGIARITQSFSNATGRIIYINKKGEIIWNEKYDLTIR